MYGLWSCLVIFKYLGVFAGSLQRPGRGVLFLGFKKMVTLKRNKVERCQHVLVWEVKVKADIISLFVWLKWRSEHILGPIYVEVRVICNIVFINLASCFSCIGACFPLEARWLLGAAYRLISWRDSPRSGQDLWTCTQHIRSDFNSRLTLRQSTRKTQHRLLQTHTHWEQQVLTSHTKPRSNCAIN